MRVKTLTEILTKELEVTPERSYQSDLRPARRAVRLLNTLQKSTQVFIIRKSFKNENLNILILLNQIISCVGL